VNIFRIAHVEADCHGSVREVESAPLLIAEGTPGLAEAGREARDLDVQEGKIALPPLAAPIVDEGGEDFLVETDAAEVAVGLALIPDNSLDGEGSRWRDHGVEEGGGPPRIEIGVPVKLHGATRLPGQSVFAFLGFQYGGQVLLLVGDRRPEGKNRHEGVGGDGIEADPGFRGTSSPGGVDQPNWDVLALFDLASEEIGYR